MRLPAYPPLRAVTFDLDGTLVDLARIATASRERLSAETAR
jgi:phosphoglycolate phosphatase-like HAD superfamily hydrolase